MATDNLVIVESPAKAKTINKYLGSNYKVIASFGHIRDLPSKDGSVLPDQDFHMLWEASKRSESHIKEIVKAAKTSKEVYLATDPDREGEAISWHICETLKEKKVLKDQVVKRIAFNEITKSAIQESMGTPRDIDSGLVEAYLARRALDYLVGFTISPILWRRLPGSKSAGRVQSVALRLICERETEIENFKTQEYWSITGLFSEKDKEKFKARLQRYSGEKLEKFSVANEKQAADMVSQLEKHQYFLKNIQEKTISRNPSSPFTTSTLQQEASRKLRFGATRTMRTAQQLYEGVQIGNETVGIITYMRTDSVNLSKDAISQSRKVIEEGYGTKYLPAKPRIYKSKAKNAQEAHEAIRPTSLARTPKEIKSFLTDDQFKLYDLIWKRTLSSQMASAVFNQVSLDIKAKEAEHQFRASGQTLVFDGFLKVYHEDKDDGEEDKNKESESLLPKVEANSDLDLHQLDKKQHFTDPPPRYTEASLVKKMEELGIGRPSTYASIIQVLQDRNYVQLESRRFVPEERGRIVTSFLKSYFTRYVEYDFTAALENKLDDISNGLSFWKEVLRQFWDAFNQTALNSKEVPIEEILVAIEKELAPHLFPPNEDGSENTRECPTCKEGRLGLKLGRFGSFIGCSLYPDCRYTRQLEEQEDGEKEKQEDNTKDLGTHPDNGQSILLKKGPYGHYIQLGEGGSGEKPKRVSIPKDVSLDAVNLEMAIRLLLLPREIGKHPETGEDISSGLGRYGPYLKHGKKFTSLSTTEEALTIGINRAVDILASGNKAAAKELGEHPETKDKITVQKGRYGPYIKHGKKNVKIPKGYDFEKLTLEEAVDIINKTASK